MTKIRQKTLILLGAALAFALVAAGGYTALFVAMKNKTVATTPLTEKIDELSGRESRITSSVSILRMQNTNIEKLSAYFFKESEVVEFTKKIEELGALSGTQLTLNSLEQGFTEKTVPYLNFQVSATGKFADLQRLLILLENFPGKIEWRTVNMSLVGAPAPTLSPDGKVISSPATKGGIYWKLDAFLVARNFIN